MRPCRWGIFPGLVLVCLIAVATLGCGASDTPRVVTYVALDRIFSEPVLKDFERETGIRVDAVFDVEASKTVGLVNRLVAEKDRPRCDVFWNNEIMHTLRLAEMDLLEPYVSPNASDIPAAFRDEDGLWTGFAARGRCIIYNKDSIAADEVPLGLEEWGADPRWDGRFAVASPRFGTTTTHMAALLTLWGEERLSAMWEAWRRNNVAILAGNATVKNEVAAGRFAFGLTDTDDVFLAMDEGANVGLLYPREGLLIPNTVALVRGAPHGENGRALIDYILRRETEARLAASSSGQIPLRDGVGKPERVPGLDAVSSLPVRWPEAAARAAESAALMDRLLGQTSRP